MEQKSKLILVRCMSDLGAEAVSKNDDATVTVAWRMRDCVCARLFMSIPGGIECIGTGH